MKVQWTKFMSLHCSIWPFLYWVKSWLGLVIVPFIYDAYISKKDSLAVVEGCRSTRKIRYELGRCIGICTRCGVFHQSILLPKLCHSIVFA